jgi:DNA-binding CsgD family transcriptional regulator
MSKNPKANIKCTCNNDEVLLREVMKFKGKLNNILDPKLNITNREKQILQLIALGRTSDEISKKLLISIKTVNTHRQNLIKKFNVKNTAALINLI